MNTIVIAGRLTRDAETKQVGSDQVVSFSVAEDVFVNRHKHAQFFDVSMWGERGGKIKDFLTKGRQVTVSGSLTTREHNGKTYLQVRANDVALQGGGDGAKSSGTSTRASQQDNDDSGIPF